MSRRFRPARRDANERVIIDALLRAGCIVHQLDADSLPDLLVGTPDGRWVLLEVKLPLGPKGGAIGHQLLSEGQVEFFARAAEKKLPVRMVRSEKAALRACGCLASIIEAGSKGEE